MNRHRDRKSAAGLLARMEARPRKDGLVTYRYHPVGGKPLNLGTDRAEAIRRVASMNGQADGTGTIGALWKDYKKSDEWDGLKPRTQADYEVYSVPLLAVFSSCHASSILAPDVARYLRVERKSARVRANREIALLGNLIALAIERGEATANPCRGGQVPRNKERPRTEAPDPADLRALVEHARAKGGTWPIITMAAEFAALAGSRQVEFLPLRWPQWDAAEVRLDRAKQRLGVKKVEKVECSPALIELRERLQAVAVDGRAGAVFANRHGNPYTASGFAAMWGKLMREAVKKGVISRRFTFHDLRAFYTTAHKERTGNLPDLHASPTTTSRIYERSGVARRKAL